MKPAPFAYARPSTLEEALRLLADNPDAKVLAGGQSLVPLLSMRLASPAMLVDINAIPGLSYVRAEPGDGVRVGALARHSDVLGNRPAREVQPLLALALGLVAHPTIRNRGTTVGSLVHADAAAEMPAVMTLLGGRVTTASTAGRREIEAADLYVGPLESSLRADEVAVEAFFPALPGGAGVACEELSRRQGDYALCGVAVMVALDDERTAAATVDRAVRSVQAAYFSVADVPTVVDLGEAVGAALTETSLAAAGELALSRLDPGEDLHATAAYRRQLVRTLTRRAVVAAHADARARMGT